MIETIQHITKNTGKPRSVADLRVLNKKPVAQTMKSFKSF